MPGMNWEEVSSSWESERPTNIIEYSGEKRIMNQSPDYFFTSPANVSGATVRIEGEEFSHLALVMRKKEGETIRVVDGMGNAYDVQIDSIEKKAAYGTILMSYANHNESHHRITLAVGILKNPSRFEFLIEKATELGVREFIPLRTSRTIPEHAKIERWQKLAVAAMKQSCRSFLPIVHEVQRLEEVITTGIPYETKLIFHEKCSQVFSREMIKTVGGTSTLALIGPEGGFTDEELDLACKNGFTACSLGERRLRTETAGIVAASLLLI